MKKKQQINKQHEWFLEKKSEIRTSNRLHSTQSSTTWAISDVTIYNLNEIDEQVNVNSSGTNLETKILL